MTITAALTTLPMRSRVSPHWPWSNALSLVSLQLPALAGPERNHVDDSDE